MGYKSADNNLRGLSLHRMMLLVCENGLANTNRVITSVVFILLLCALVSTVSADSVTPPGGITICGYVTYVNEIGIWWFNPYDPDFGGVQMWLDDEYLGTTGAGDHFYNAYSSIIGTHTFSTHTFDNSSNVNTTWVNLTFMTKEYPGCTENWTCDTCSPMVSPVAAFSANQTSGIVPLAVLFTDNSTNTPTAWNWSFGDGNYSAIQNPEYTFTRAGSYSIILNASNIAGSNSSIKVDYILVIPQSPVASFTSNINEGLAPLDIQFTDTSANSPTMWNWSFGDTSWFNTTDSLLSNTTKSFPMGGNYTITLYVSNSGGSDTVSHYVDVWNRTTNDFAANVTSGNVTFTVQFTDTSFNATSWYWIFDGMNTSTSQNPVFTYTVPGIYSVNHSSSNAHDTFWTNKTNYIVAYLPVATAPVANFTGTPTSGIFPLTVQFTDNSLGSPMIWNWSFGDGNYSTLQSLSHTYAFAGTFTVSLNATNSAGSNLLTRTNYIDVTISIIPPTASFTGIPSSGAVPLAVQFTDTSNGSPTRWNWSFGDGSYSTARNPSHTYSIIGTYTVSLNATNSAGSNTATRTNYITVSTTPTVTPTLLSDGSDTPRFVPTTGAATDNGVRAGERITLPFAGNLEADDTVPVVVVAISLVPSIDIQGVMASAIQAPLERATKIPGNPPAYYLDITINWIREEVVREADIRFSVDDGWLKEQGIAPTDLVMTRYYDNTWSELPTRMEQYTNGRYYYSATTSGFPYFAVTRKGTGVPTTTPTLISLVTTTLQIKSESKTITTSRPVTPIPVRTKPVTTTTTVPPVSQAESPEFPIIWIVFGVAVFTGFILSIVVIRRWWIRKQNPALFRKYD
jgi:PGF-pre-PGF domain-containing protein